MSTRSYIGVRNLDASVDYIYCHFDGYPEGVGTTLIKHYADMDKVNALLKLGDLSVLGEEIGEQHDFNKPVKGWCRAYGRDRGEKNVSAKNRDYDELIHDQNVDYVYIFDGDYWECFSTWDPAMTELYKLYKMEKTN